MRGVNAMKFDQRLFVQTLIDATNALIDTDDYDRAVEYAKLAIASARAFRKAIQPHQRSLSRRTTLAPQPTAPNADGR